MEVAPTHVVIGLNLLACRKTIVEGKPSVEISLYTVWSSVSVMARRARQLLEMALVP